MNKSRTYSSPFLTIESQRSGRFSVPCLKKSDSLEMKDFQKAVRQWVGKIKMKWNKIGRIERTWNNLAINRMGVIMLQKSSMMSSRFSFLNCHLKTTYLLAINLNCDGCIPQKQFIVDDAIFISSDVLAFIMRDVFLLKPSYSFLFLTNIFRF